jgi:hypothetical protein
MDYEHQYIRSHLIAVVRANDLLVPSATRLTALTFLANFLTPF